MEGPAALRLLVTAVQGDFGQGFVKALRLSLQATGNAWFVSRSEPIATALKNGVPLTDEVTPDQDLIASENRPLTRV